jgi:hypothetical protein
VVFYAFNVVVIVGVGFLVFILRHFAREARPRHVQLQERSRGMTEPLEVLRFSGHTYRVPPKASHCKQRAGLIK